MHELPLKLFLSYSHEDINQKSKLEKQIRLLENNGVINQWSDSNIIPGSDIEKTIFPQLMISNIIIFLVTPDWTVSDSCRREWDMALDLCSKCPDKRMVPIIGSSCNWMDYSSMKEILVLPYDGKPVDIWENENQAWKNVYDGIKRVAEDLKKKFVMKPDYKEEISKIEFCKSGSENISLEDIFVFPTLSFSISNIGKEKKVNNLEQLLNENKSIILGDGQTGKTKLCSWIHLYLDNIGIPCLYIDFEQVSNKRDIAKMLSAKFYEQTTGDFDKWMLQDNKVIVFDNLDKQEKCLRIISYAEENFEKIYILTSTDIYKTYYIDDDRFLDYTILDIQPFDHRKQEVLIKKWLYFKSGQEEIEYGKVDLLEKEVNSIVIDNRVIPRYPFFILSILQTYESFMPESLSVTAYGHCYNALIVARLIKSGISREDKMIEMAFTFCSNLAYLINNIGIDQSISCDEYENFLEDHKKNFLTKDSIINRLFGVYGILKKSSDKVSFVLSYSYYFFLGKYLSKNIYENNKLICEMVKRSYARNNALTLIFTIHHSNDSFILEELLTNTICVIDGLFPAKLNKDETKYFNNLAKKILPETLDMEADIDDERQKEMENRNALEIDGDKYSNDVVEVAEKNKFLDEVFQCNKNIEILSQILSNKTGSLKKTKIFEIIEIMCDAGLRMASIMISKRDEIESGIRYIAKKYSKETNKSSYNKEDIYKIENMIDFWGAIWVTGCVVKISSSINNPELRDIVLDLVESKDTPAYDILYYYYLLDSCLSFDSNLKDEFSKLFKKYSFKDFPFLNKMIYSKTRNYFRTHNVKYSYKQEVYSLLGVPANNDKILPVNIPKIE